MRHNLPCTGIEHPFPPGRTLASVTDTKGRITYCNASFAEVSGYASSELIGQPHNIVRHPDMPAEAFRDMWATIQSGAPWVALVKNRRKNGDHYWVRANVTPMRDGDRITGYLSIRTEPDRASVDAAERLYGKMREEAAAGRSRRGLEHGIPVRSDAVGRALRRLRPGAGGRLILVQAALAAGVLAASQLRWPAAGAVSGALVAAAAAWTWHRVIRPLDGIVADANRLASGDLSHVVATGAPGAAGAIQHALTQLSVNLRTVVLDTRDGITGVRGTTREVASGNRDLSARTEAQASSLEQTAASMEQVSATARQGADAAVEGARRAHTAAEVARRSQDAVSAAADAMGELARSTDSIREIIQVVEGVAFQTNILSLNAAVEAARAGESGRGFAVVAAEVRALAQRTASAVQEIREIIDESGRRAALGRQRGAEANQRVADAMACVHEVSEMLGGISDASVQQEAGFAQINAAVAHMDGITQRNAGMVEALAAAAAALEGQVDAVDRSMRIFRLAGGERSLGEADAVALRIEARAAP